MLIIWIFEKYTGLVQDLVPSCFMNAKGFSGSIIIKKNQKFMYLCVTTTTFHYIFILMYPSTNVLLIVSMTWT